MANYKPRTTAPSISDKNWISTSFEGYNIGLVRNSKTGSVLPNCTSYCYGRWQEILGTKSTNLCHFQAELWYGNKGKNGDKYERGQYPKLGAVICWAKGSTKSTKDGSGHVAIVEKINDNGSLLLSESGYNSTKRFWTQTLKKPYKYGSAYTFQGFIYLPKKFTYNGEFPTLPKRGYFLIGDKGKEVAKVQRFLNWALDLWGTPKELKIDKSYGPATTSMVAEFEKLVDIREDGSFGKSCLAKAKAFTN